MDALLSPKNAAARLGIGRSSLYRLREFDEAFPEPVQVSARRVAWRESDLAAWIAARPPASSTPEGRARREQGTKAGAASAAARASE